MSLSIFITSVILFFILKFIGNGLANPIDMMNNHYRETTENSRALVGLLIFIDVVIIAVSGIWSAWAYL